MSARVIAEASLTIPVQGKHLDEAGIVADPQLSLLARNAIRELMNAIAGSVRSTDTCVESVE